MSDWNQWWEENADFCCKSHPHKACREAYNAGLKRAEARVEELEDLLARAWRNGITASVASSISYMLHEGKEEGE